MGRKNINDMTDRELLMELVQTGRRRNVLRTLGMILMLVLLGVIIWLGFTYIPLIIALGEKYANMIEEILKSINELKGYAEKIPFSEEEIKTTIETIKTLTEQLNKLLKIFR